MLTGIKRAVFFGAHTDDEMICAGTLHRLVRGGCEVTVVSFSPAAVEADRTGGLVSAERVEPEWRSALSIIGARGRFCPMSWWAPSARLHEHGQDIAQYAYDYCEVERPDLAFILSPEDENPAHAEVGRQCERVMRGRVPHVVRCQFPWNYGLGRPNLYVGLDIQDMDAKRRVINAYQSQKFRYDYEAMLLAYACADGLSVKLPAAEKFELLRSVVWPSLPAYPAVAGKTQA